MITRPERAAMTTLARAPWAAGVVFSLAMHAALAAFVVGQSAQAPAVGGAVVIDVVLVDGPDAAPAADPNAPITETPEAPAADAPAVLVEAPGAQDAEQDEPDVRDPVQAAARTAAEKLPTLAAPAAAQITPRPRAVDLAGPEKPLSTDAARAAADTAAAKKPDKAPSIPKSASTGREAAANDEAAETGAPKQKAALPSGASRGASPLAGNPKPVYPRTARRRNQEGRVLLRVLVMPDGGSGAVTVVESSGYGVLDRAAVAAVGKWRFRPATRAGTAVTSVLEVPVRFRLRQDAE